jgi:hypothetical protein
MENLENLKQELLDVIYKEVDALRLGNFIKKGEWYRVVNLKTDDEIIFTPTDLSELLKHKQIIAYGFKNGEYVNFEILSIGEIKDAEIFNVENVFDLFEMVVKKRYFINDIILPIDSLDEAKISDLSISFNNGSVMLGNLVVFKDGSWADVLYVAPRDLEKKFHYSHTIVACEEGDDFVKSKKFIITEDQLKKIESILKYGNNG